MVDEIINVGVEPIEIAPTIIKEGEQHFEKVPVDLEALIKNQQDIIASLQVQMDRANATLQSLISAR